MSESGSSRPPLRSLKVRVPEAECGIVPAEANTGAPLRGDYERMARRRFQNPKPFRHGRWWYLQYWRDDFSEGKPKRKRPWAKLAPSTMPEREVKKIAAEFLRPLNQGLESIGSATNFTKYVEETYIPVVMPLMAKSTQNRYQGVIRNYLLPAFGKLCLRDATTLAIQRYFSTMVASELTHSPKTRFATFFPAFSFRPSSTDSWSGIPSTV